MVKFKINSWQLFVLPNCSIVQSISFVSEIFANIYLIIFSDFFTLVNSIDFVMYNHEILFYECTLHIENLY